MLKNHIVVIPFNLPWEWSTDYTNQTAYILSKKSTVICFMWAEAFSLKEYLQKKILPKTIKKYSSKLYLFYPILYVPFRRFKLIYQLNLIINFFLLKLFIRLLEIKNKPSGKILWIFDPSTRFIMDVLNTDWKVIYDCIDFFRDTGKSTEDRKKIAENERKLVKEAHIVCTISTVLKKNLQRYRRDIYLVPQGFRLHDFQGKRVKAPKLTLQKPVIGFVGGVNYRINYDLLVSLAQRNPIWNFVLWGPLIDQERIGKKEKSSLNKLLKLPNVVHGFSRKKQEIPTVISQFNIGMIPYDASQEFNKFCYPMKLFEYFYEGKPVVATPIEELKRFPKFVKIGNTYKEWEKILSSLLSRSWPKSYQYEQKRLAEKNSWENKVEAILSHLER